MAVSPQIINAFVSALNDKFENKQTNKKTDISGDFSTDTASYPTVQAVKNYTASAISGKADTAHTHTTSQITDFPSIPSKVSDLTNDSGFIDSSALATYVEESDLAEVATSGDYDDLSNKPTLASLNGVVTVEKQATAEEGFTATYVVKQGGAQVGVKINIPKDLLIQSAEVKTVGATPTAIETEHDLDTGDSYLEFIANTVDDDDAQAPLIIPITDLFDLQTADETTITLVNGVFSVKNGGITLAKLDSGVQTSLGYADAFNSSAAKNITSTDISNWNAKTDTSDVESTVESVLSAVTTALSS